MFKKPLSLAVLLCFLINSLGPVPRAHADSVIPVKTGIQSLPEPGTMVNLSQAYVPVLMKGLKVHPENPFKFDFILDTGSDPKLSSPNAKDVSFPNASVGNPQQEHLKSESTKLIKYFLAALTVPEKDLWVNLSPYEKDRMIADNLGQTEMGRDMLAQDYVLKQLTASLIYPEKDLGKAFWDKVYAKAQQMYGTTQIPVNTFNKVWIVADKADIFERNNVAYVVGAHLKVMLEEDYTALNKGIDANFVSGGVLPQKLGAVPSTMASQIVRVNQTSTQELNDKGLVSSLASNIVREIILPEIEREVNEGKNFAPLRQMFYSMILASWFKMALKDSILSQMYGNQSKLGGLSSPNALVGDPKKNDNELIYQRYLQAYKKGVFNYIKEESDYRHPEGDSPKDLNTTPRKYFSGGLSMAMATNNVLRRSQPWSSDGAITGSLFEAGVSLKTLSLFPSAPKPPSAAMSVGLASIKGATPTDMQPQLKKLASMLSKQKAIEGAKHLGLDLRMSVYGMLHPLFLGHLREIHRRVADPADAQPKIAVYGAAGVDVSTVLLATGAREIYMIDQDQIHSFKNWLRSWGSIEEMGDSIVGSYAADYTADKFVNGFGVQEHGFIRKTAKLIAELKALGVNKKDISFEEVLGEVTLLRVLRFYWSPTGVDADKQLYTVHFIEGDITKPETFLNKLEGVKGKVDFYYQRAGFGIANRYGSFIPQITALLKPQGYVITDNHYMDGNKVVWTANLSQLIATANLPLREIPVWGELEAWRSALIEFGDNIRVKNGRVMTGDRGYGWDLSLYQKSAAMTAHLERTPVGMERIKESSLKSLFRDVVREGDFTSRLPPGNITIVQKLLLMSFQPGELRRLNNALFSSDQIIAWLETSRRSSMVTWDEIRPKLLDRQITEGSVIYKILSAFFTSNAGVDGDRIASDMLDLLLRVLNQVDFYSHAVEWLEVDEGVRAKNVYILREIAKSAKEGDIIQYNALSGEILKVINMKAPIQERWSRVIVGAERVEVASNVGGRISFKKMPHPNVFQALVMEREGESNGFYVGELNPSEIRKMTAAHQLILTKLGLGEMKWSFQRLDKIGTWKGLSQYLESASVRGQVRHLMPGLLEGKLNLQPGVYVKDNDVYYVTVDPSKGGHFLIYRNRSFKRVLAAVVLLAVAGGSFAYGDAEVAGYFLWGAVAMGAIANMASGLKYPTFNDGRLTLKSQVESKTEGEALAELSDASFLTTEGLAAIAEHVESESSKAMNVRSVSEVRRGGIDLDRAKMQMNVKRDASMDAGQPMFKIDPSMIADFKKNGDGLEFTIETIVPITNLPLLLGLRKEEEQGLQTPQLAGA